MDDSILDKAESHGTTDEIAHAGSAGAKGRLARMLRPRRWQDLSLVQKVVNIGMGVVELVLVGLALRDIARRPASEINGKKRTWVLASFVQPVGPIIYFIFGRKKGQAPAGGELLPA